MSASTESMDRIAILKKQIFEEFLVKKEWWGDDLTILDQPGVAEKPVIIRKALAFEKVCKEMPVELKPHELIVGVATMSSVGFGHTFPKYETDEEAEYFAKYSLDRKSVWGHHLPYYPKVLRKGYDGIILDIDAQLATLRDDETEKRDFLEAARHTLVAAREVPLRYARLVAETAAREENIDRKAELLEIARICKKVPMQPAETFQEALQSVWFTHMLLHSTLSFTPLGRVDQYLWPYYKADKEAGRITREQAAELVASFLVKFNERTQFLKEHMENHSWMGDWSQGGDPDEPTTTFDMENSADYTYGQSANHWLQSAIVGGLGPDGKDATNDLSYLFLEIINRLELVSPMLGARVHSGSPKEYLRFIADELCVGGAQPVIFNDDVICKGLMERLHIPPEDAYDYSSDGCWEVLVYGKTEYSYGHIELMPIMEAMLNNGKSLVSGKMIGRDDGDIISRLETFEDFYQAYLSQVYYRMDNAIRNKIKYYDLLHQIAPEPFLSTMVEDCIDKGLDMTNRGARYRIYSLFATGISHCVDSLAAFRKLVYEDKVVSLAEAVAAIRANWEGYEELRQRCLNRAPKYGNDDDAADDLMVRFMTDFCDRADKLNREIDWLWVSAGVATFENYPRFGHNAWASFDGRVAHEAFSSNYTPAVGRDRQGPTAVILSSTKFDLSRLNSGCPVDLRVSFNKETRGENRDILCGFLESCVELGGNVMTITKVDLETLKKAQAEPEKYLSLRVRLGGVTAYFVQLAKAQQDEYMRRTEHAM
ncbi:MAG: hypothetical protein LIQ31_06925 [Planctomycetes bacterium]|nr:hypothetical protein [Planctomycetota bacterium]